MKPPLPSKPGLSSARPVRQRGILKQILVVNCASRRLRNIEMAVRDGGFEATTVDMDRLKEHGFNQYEGIIISGSPILLTQTDYTKHLEWFDFIRSIGIPILGICFGHQIVGLEFGARVFRGAEQRTKQAVEIVERDSLFRGIESNLILHEDHCEGITLPSSFDLLAKSDYYEVEAMKHKQRNIFGVQFHPEVSGEVGRRIINNFLELCRSDVS